MAIARKPKSAKAPSKEQKAGKFIRAGVLPVPADPSGISPVNGRTFRPVLTNFEVTLLGRIDSLAVHMGLSRSAFIVNAVAERVLKLERGE